MLSGKHNPEMNEYVHPGFKQRLRKLVHNSTFRMVALYFILFILSSLILLSFIYWSAVGYIYKQLDHHIEYDMERLQTIYNQAGLEALITAIKNSLEQKNYESIYLLYNKKNQHILAGNLDNIPPGVLKGWHILELSGLSEANMHKAHSARVLIMPLPNDLILLNGLDIESAHEQEHMIFNSLIAGIAIILLLGTLGGFIISISTIKKINLINNTIKEISEGNLSLRIPSRGTDDDYDLLAQNINEMLEQINHLMQGIQNMSNNIAHDLRTPLTRLRVRLESIHPDGVEAQAGIQEALLETDNLLTTFNALLRINQMESGARYGHFTRLEINILVQDVVDLFAPLAEDKDISMQMTAKDTYFVDADRNMLFQMFSNLVDNAIKYTPRQGKISISLNLAIDKTQMLHILITDTGIGIPEEETEKVLQPFYRLEKHRDQQGNGLGLSLVSAIVKLHNGKIEFHDNAPGLRVSLFLPLKTKIL